MSAQYSHTLRLSPGWRGAFHRHWPFIVMLAIYVATTIGFIFQVTAFAPPNEQLHYEYVALLRRTGQLPDLATSARMDERPQPPVYYVLTALMSLPFPTPRLDTEMDLNPYY